MRLAELKLRKAIRKIITELCDSSDVSSGFIKPNGEYVDLEYSNMSHDEFVYKILVRELPEYDDLLEKFLRGPSRADIVSFFDFLLEQEKWIRVANAATYEGPPINQLPSVQISKMLNLLNGCLDQLNKKDSYFSYDVRRNGNVDLSSSIITKSVDTFVSWIKGGGKTKAIGKSKVAMFH